jgi:hypothetical protein
VPILWNSNDRFKPSRILPWFLSLGVLALGIFWSLTRGAPDYRVFDEAGSLVLSGRFMAIYSETPDRFLYAPGFAWIFSPLSRIGTTAGLVFWGLFKASVLIHAFLLLGRELESRFRIHRSQALWGLVVCARPLLIDFQYGQVNSLMLGAAVGAAMSFVCQEPERKTTLFYWMLLAWVGVAKLYVLPVLALIYLPSTWRNRSWDSIRLAVVGMIASILLLPLIQVSIDQWETLYREWVLAIQTRGIPLETHNQSFFAFLERAFGGVPAHVVALYASRDFGLGPILSFDQIQKTAVALSFVMMALMIWILLRHSRGPIAMSVLVALLVLPSHLVWKPYAIFAAPVASVIAAWAFGALREPKRIHWGRWMILFAGFCLMSLSTINLLGAEGIARFEGYSGLYWTHLAMTLIAMAIGFYSNRANSCPRAL